jgi:hypothetical protein
MTAVQHFFAVGTRHHPAGRLEMVSALKRASFAPDSGHALAWQFLGTTQPDCGGSAKPICRAVALAQFHSSFLTFLTAYSIAVQEPPGAGS